MIFLSKKINMATPRFLKKNYKPQETFKSKFENAIYKIFNTFLETKMVKHSGTKGTEREIPLIEFLNLNLPKTYSTVSGEIVDLFNNSSPQLDVMIYDKIRNIPFRSGQNYILPAEALISSIEVKSKLTKNEIKKILINVKKLKDLKPFGRPLDLAKGGRKKEETISCRYYHCVFAYSSDLSKDNWLNKEFIRIKEVARQLDIDYTLIDRIIVLDRGIINLAKSMGKISDDNSTIFMYFYMHLLNFIQRENSRRQNTPFLDYSGSMSERWVKLIN